MRRDGKNTDIVCSTRSIDTSVKNTPVKILIQLLY